VRIIQEVVVMKELVREVPVLITGEVNMSFGLGWLR
jgi:hypothetical protein